MKPNQHSLYFALALLLWSASAAAQPKTTDLSYFNSSPGSSFFPLPGTYGVTAGTDTARTVIAYSERFSCPFAATYIDSVSVLLTIDSIGPNAAIAVEAFPTYWSNGHSFVNFDTSQIDENELFPTDPMYQQDSSKLYTFTMNHTEIPDTDFFVSVIAPDPIHTRAFIWGDSVSSPTYLPVDENRDRSRLLLDQPYGGSVQYYLAGTQHGSSNQYWYPNFVMIAYVSTPTGSVDELYPAAEDPLAFYVERMQNGAMLLHFTPQQAAPIRLELFDENGQIVSTLFSGTASLTDYSFWVPATLARGMYFARISTPNAVETRKIIITQ